MTTTVSFSDRVAAWRFGRFRTTNPPEAGVVDGLTRLLILGLFGWAVWWAVR
ncbi:MAG TPA: hypothetical protein VGJ53_16785 [Micromonosporaceae bacterium]